MNAIRLIAVLLIGLALTSCHRDSLEQFQGPIMGTQYQLTLACEAKQSPQALHQLALAQMNAVNDAMSTYLATSELSRFNQQQSTAWQPLSQDLLSVIDIAQKVSEQSDGAFDITIAPMVSLWGFGATKKPQLERSIPDDQAIARLQKTVGYHHIIVDAERQQWRKQRPDLHIDLSAVAKGYAVDQVSEALIQAGCDDHLIDIGGELKAVGYKTRDGDLWRIAVEKPNRVVSHQEHIQELLMLTNLGVASSGDYRNFFQVANKRYSHTIDPRTGRPIEHGLAAVTVLHQQTAVADAWATALMVLGDDAPNLAEKMQLAAYFIFRQLPPNHAEDSKNTQKYRIVATKQFDKFRMNK